MKKPDPYTATYEEIKAWCQTLPPMTNEETEEQAMCFAYGNLACSTNHKPTREAFASFCRDAGWADERFERWAKDREWWTR